MAEVMTSERWKKYTEGGFAAIRSSKLKAVDASLVAYHAAPSTPNLVSLRMALKAFIAEEGPSWKSKPRNRLHAVEHLYLQAHGYTGMDKTFRPGEKAAMADAVAFIEQERSRVIETIFKDRQLEWRAGVAKKLAQQKLTTITSVRGVAVGIKEFTNAPKAVIQTSDKAAGAAQMAARIMSELIPPDLGADVTTMLLSVVPTFVKDLTTACLPFAGVIASGGAAVFGGLKVVRASYRVDRAKMHAERGVRADGPGEAVQALIQILRRERNNDAFEAAVALGEFGGKLAGVLADGGTATTTAVGLAASVVRLCNIIRIVVRDVIEKNEANALIRAGKLDMGVFEACPLLGCYLILCVPRSMVINMLTEKWGTLGWMDDVERMVEHHILPLEEQARRVVAEHRFVVAGLQNFPGIASKNEKELKRMRAHADLVAQGKAKSKYEGFGSDNLPANLRLP